MGDDKTGRPGDGNAGAVGEHDELAALRREVRRLRAAEEALRLERDISLAQTKAATLPEAMTSTLALLLGLDGIDCGGIYRIDPARGGADLIAHQNLSDEFVANAGHYDADTPHVRIALGQEPAYFTALDFDPAGEARRQMEGVLCLAVVPIRHEGRGLGCLNLASKTWKVFPESTCHLIESVASHLGAFMAQREAQDALRASETRFRELADLLPQVVFEMDMRGRFLYANRFGFELLGYSEEDVERGLDVTDITPPEEHERARMNIAKTLEGGPVEPREYLLLSKDGRGVPSLLYSNRLMRDGRPVGIRGIAMDITEHKRMEEALRAAQSDLERRVEARTRALARTNRELADEVAQHRKTAEALEEAENRFRHTFENAADAIFWGDPETGLIVNCNAAAEALMEQSRDKLIGLHQARLHPKEMEGHFRRMFASHAERMGTALGNAEIVTREGRRKKVSIVASSIMVGQRRLVQGVFQDVTALREAEMARNQLFTAMEQAAESMMVTDPSGVIQYVNPAFERISGYASDEVIGKTPRILRSGRHDGKVYEELWRTISQGAIWHGRLINRCKDGSLVEEEVVISPVFDEAGCIANYVALKHNVTERMSLERQLRQAQRMEAIGTLAGGIAHDFRNILSLIMGYGEIGMGMLEDGHPARTSIANILKAGTRATSIVQQILTFSRRGEQDLRPLPPHIIVKEALELLKASLPSTIRIEHAISSDCGFILGDPSQLHQVAMNLCTNAYQAMAGTHGTLKVTLQSDEVKAQQLADVGILRPGRYVRLTVSDTGHGMSREIVSRIFDPFFTTKPPTEGTGLGLSTVHGIVLDSGGAITVSSELGQGTTFQVYLPRTDDEQHVPLGDGEIVMGSGQRLAVVDDDHEVLAVHREMLVTLGYEVSPFGNGMDAFAAISEEPRAYQAVLTDQLMPGMTGLELAHELKTRWPALPVILITGIPEEFAAQPDARELASVIAKPVTPAALSVAVRDAITG